MIRLGDRRNDGCPDESVSCKHGALHRACERMRSDGDPWGAIERSESESPRRATRRNDGEPLSHRMQPFAGRGRRERSGPGRRPMGSVPRPRSEREPRGQPGGGPRLPGPGASRPAGATSHVGRKRDVSRPESQQRKTAGGGLDARARERAHERGGDVVGVHDHAAAPGAPCGRGGVVGQAHGEDVPDIEVPLIVRVGRIQRDEGERAAVLVRVGTNQEPHALAPARLVLDRRRTGRACGHLARGPSAALPDMSHLRLPSSDAATGGRPSTPAGSRRRGGRPNPYLASLTGLGSK